jgi:glycosyltransferase involved in cell wall biosynthesis
MHQAFIQSNRAHIMMLTVHGIHEWQVVPGLQDTGGQNVFVNLFSSALTKRGFKITTVNRGGYPHPKTGSSQSGLCYLDENQRILHIEDGLHEFVRKEDMGDRMPILLDSLIRFLEEDGVPVELVISHYWDGGMLGALLIQNKNLNVKHIWVPHSLGMLKRCYLSPDARKDLRINERIAFEREIFNQIDFLAATSSKIKTSSENDYGYKGNFLWLPPWVDQERYYPRVVTDADPIWDLLSDLSGISPAAIRGKKIITEISRTDTTKQKDVLVKAFALVHQHHPDSFLVLSIDKSNGPLAADLMNLIKAENIEGSVAAVGSIWKALPTLYATTAIYCTPSIMEGFGMSAQEAAATRVPVVSSDMVPFATEYLAGEAASKIKTVFGSEIMIGAGALIVSPGDVEGFAGAMDLLLSDETLRKKMGVSAFNATIPYFTRDHIVRDFLKGAFLSDDD